MNRKWNNLVKCTQDSGLSEGVTVTDPVNQQISKAELSAGYGQNNQEYRSYDGVIKALHGTQDTSKNQELQLHYYCCHLDLFFTVSILFTKSQ